MGPKWASGAGVTPSLTASVGCSTTYVKSRLTGVWTLPNPISFALHSGCIGEPSRIGVSLTIGEPPKSRHRTDVADKIAVGNLNEFAQDRSLLATLGGGFGQLVPEMTVTLPRAHPPRVRRHVSDDVSKQME